MNAAVAAMNERLRFLRAWARRPLTTGAVVPSSGRLARLMASAIDPAGGHVMELGGGTGSLTRGILRTGLSPAMLEVVEINPDLARTLRGRFPGVTVLEEPAQTVAGVAAGGAGGYQAIISGLPLLAMPRAMRSEILAEAFVLLRVDGSLIQFTYSPKPPVDTVLLDELGLRVERIGRVLRNVPPASVFRFTRRA
jgi:phospholipid N-methyltransferase